MKKKLWVCVDSLKIEVLPIRSIDPSTKPSVGLLSISRRIDSVCRDWENGPSSDALEPHVSDDIRGKKAQSSLGSNEKSGRHWSTGKKHASLVVGSVNAAISNRSGLEYNDYTPISSADRGKRISGDWIFLTFFSGFVTLLDVLRKWFLLKLTDKCLCEVAGPTKNFERVKIPARVTSEGWPPITRYDHQSFIFYTTETF